MTHDDLRDALALVGANLLGDEDGQRAIRENADTEGLINGLLTTATIAVRLAAQTDGVPDAVAVEQIQELLRRHVS